MVERSRLGGGRTHWLCQRETDCKAHLKTQCEADEVTKAGLWECIRDLEAHYTMTRSPDAKGVEPDNGES